VKLSRLLAQRRLVVTDPENATGIRAFLEENSR